MTPPKDPEKLPAYLENLRQKSKGNRGALGMKRSPEHKETIRKLMTGRVVTEETRRRMSEAHLGKHPTEATLEKQHKRMLGNKFRLGLTHTEETRKLLSMRIITKEQREKTSVANKGKKRSDTTKLKISLAQSGDKCYNWKGGISFEPYCEKFNNEFKNRVRAYFGYVCPECGTPQQKYKLHVHHVTSDKQVCCNNKPRLFVPLCESCHGKANHNCDYWESHFTTMIQNYYSNKCYFEKEEYVEYMGI
jgi:hypothetical protein